MKFPLDCKDSFENSFIFWLTRYVKFKLSSLSNKELKDPKALASVNFALSREIKNIEQLDGLVKSARNAGLTGINTYFNPLKKIYETMKFYELSSLKQIDEELLSEILASTTGGLSDASKKNYRISVINFFNHVEKYYESGVTAGDFMDAYKRFKEIVPAKAEEKQIFNTFEKSSGYNSYKAVQDVKTHSEEQRVTAKK